MAENKQPFLNLFKIRVKISLPFEHKKIFIIHKNK